MIAAVTPYTEFYELSSAIATPIIFILVLFVLAWTRKNGMW